MPLMVSGGSSIDYDVHGKKGPPLLLIAGLGFGRWCWFKQLPALSRHFRVITFDIRSLDRLDLLDPKDHIHGVTDLAFHPAALLDHLGIERAHVLGTSLGGFVAQELALQRPTLIDGLVLVCTSYGGPDSAPPSWEALRAMLGLGATNRVDAARRGLETATSEAYRTGHPEEYEQLLEWRITDAPSQPSYLEQMMAGARFDVSSRVRDIRASTLVLHGDDDRVVPVANAEALAEAISGAKLRVFEDAGHLVFIEQAEEVNEEIISFLKPRGLRRVWEPQTLVAKRKTEWLFRRAKEANREIVFFLKPRGPRGRRRSHGPPTKRKMKRLAERVGINKEVGDFLKLRKQQRRQRSLGTHTQHKTKPPKPKARLQSAAQITGGWMRKLRSWLSR
ncbi:MAG TPA: alpha/beta hydrolase [Rubrobacteraceae bacterium]|nr:alpha/beta hydrolase [Rubrobacteraceae bacterium]